MKKPESELFNLNKMRDYTMLRYILILRNGNSILSVNAPEFDGDLNIYKFGNQIICYRETNSDRWIKNISGINSSDIIFMGQYHRE